MIFKIENRKVIRRTMWAKIRQLKRLRDNEQQKNNKKKPFNMYPDPGSNHGVH